MSEELNRSANRTSARKRVRSIASHILFFVLLSALAFVILDPYDAVGGGFDSFPQACLVLFGVAMPLVMCVCWVIHPLTFSGILRCNGVFTAAVMTWAIGVGNSFAGVYGGSMSLKETAAGILMIFLVLLPFVAVQCAWAAVFQWVGRRLNKTRGK
jgi:hypothetical protein